MKKVITLCLFAFAMFFGTESAMAQTNKLEVNSQAAEKTEALRKFVKFDNSQRDQVYAAFQEYTQATLDLKKVETVEEGVIEKIEKLLDTKMQSILTEEQFQRYKEFSEE